MIASGQVLYVNIIHGNIHLVQSERLVTLVSALDVIVVTSGLLEDDVLKPLV